MLLTGAESDVVKPGPSYQVYLPILGAEQEEFRWAGGVHAITFPSPADRASAPGGIQKLNWYSWGRNNNDGYDDLYVPMVWKYDGETASIQADGRPLFLLNEPDYATQANMTDEEVAAALLAYQDWEGEIFGLGYDFRNFDRFRSALEMAEDTQGGPVRLDGIHLHCYFSPFAAPEGYRPALRNWRQFADRHSIPVIVSEWGWFPYTWVPPQWMADNLATVARIIQEELDPLKMFYFSWRMPDDTQNTPGVDWRLTNAADGIIGQAWRELAGV